MATPNVVDMIFGRIDRNVDTRYRDHALEQNNQQFLTQAQLDRAKMAEAQRQFNSSIGLDTEKFQTAKQQQAWANEMAKAQGVATGMLRPNPTSPQRAIPEAGAMPGNMFMQGQTFGQQLPVDRTKMVVGTGINGIEPVTPDERFQQVFKQDEQVKNADMRRVNTTKADLINRYIGTLKVNPLIATMMVENPQMAAQVLSSGDNALGVLSLIGEGILPPAVVDQVIRNMGSLRGTVAQASETDSIRALHNASATNALSNAGLANAQATNIGRVSQAEGIYNQAYVAAGKTLEPSDPNFSVLVRRHIQEMDIPQELKDAAAAVVSKDIQPRMQLQNTFLERIMRDSQTTRPNVQVPSTGNSNRPSGSAPEIVNQKPSAVTGPPGTIRQSPDALRFTQPNQNPNVIKDLIDKFNQQKLNPPNPLVQEVSPWDMPVRPPHFR